MIINDEEMLSAVGYSQISGYVYGKSKEEKGTTVYYKSGQSISYPDISPCDIIKEINKLSVK